MAWVAGAHPILLCKASYNQRLDKIVASRLILLIVMRMEQASGSMLKPADASRLGELGRHGYTTTGLCCPVCRI